MTRSRGRARWSRPFVWLALPNGNILRGGCGCCCGKRAFAPRAKTRPTFTSNLGRLRLWTDRPTFSLPPGGRARAVQRAGPRMAAESAGGQTRTGRGCGCRQLPRWLGLRPLCARSLCTTGQLALLLPPTPSSSIVATAVQGSRVEKLRP